MFHSPSPCEQGNWFPDELLSRREMTADRFLHKKKAPRMLNTWIKSSSSVHVFLGSLCLKGHMRLDAPWSLYAMKEIHLTLWSEGEQY